MSSTLEPAIWSRDTGQQIPCFDRCLLIKTLKLKFAAYDCGYASFQWKIKRYFYGVQFGINCTALDQSKLSNFVECTIITLTGFLGKQCDVTEESALSTLNLSLFLCTFARSKSYIKNGIDSVHMK